MSYCKHPRMQSTARVDHCPDCGYEFYYADVHAENSEERKTKLLASGQDEHALTGKLDHFKEDKKDG